MEDYACLCINARIGNVCYSADPGIRPREWRFRSLSSTQHQAITLTTRLATIPARCAFGLNSVTLVALEPDEPVETVTVDDLPVGCAPRPLLQVVHDPAAFAEPGKPGAQS